MNKVIIQSGGLGLRVGANIPKQYIEIYNKPIIVYTLEKFQANDLVDQIIIICDINWQSYVKDLCIKYNITKFSYFIDNHINLFLSTKNAIDSINDSNNDLILIHEAVRPLVTDEMITDSFNVAKSYGNAIACYKSIDETGELEDNCIKSLHTEKELYVFQNPHTFTIDKLKWAYNIKNESIGNQGTAILMYKLGECLYSSKGSPDCFKITYPEDIIRFKQLISK